MVIGETDPAAAPQMARPLSVPQDKIDNIMSGINNTGVVKMNNHRKKLRQRFDIIKKLGQGTYGKVQLGINKETGQEVAIKTIKKCKIEAEADLVRIRREVQIMSSVQHPNIIHIYEVFENREKMILVMEFAAGGELYDYLSERKVLTEDEARRIFRQVSTAVYYCHKHKICHRDLKLENILLDENGNAKIADFGLSNVFDEQRLLATFCGSPLYASPEIVKGTPYLGPEVDCWSLGVLLYTLVYGAMPFDGSNFKRLVKQISQGNYYEPKKPSQASPLIREMLTVCPQRRATIEQICSHWWVNEGYRESCLDLAEDLANQTPVRLDVLLSLSPISVTADQLVVPSGDDNKNNERVSRSHSVGSICEIGNTEAERRILDMVAAGGEAALMPSPTRTITPAASPVQAKRKLQNTVSTENATGVIRKKEKPTENQDNEVSERLNTEMEVENVSKQNIPETVETYTQEQQPPILDNKPEEKIIVRQRTITKLNSVDENEENTINMSPTKVIKKFVNKHKTSDLVTAISKAASDKSEELKKLRKNSLPDESLIKSSDGRRSRILETAEKFQNMGNSNNDKPKKLVIPGVSVGSFKKEFERKASLTSGNIISKQQSFEKREEQSPEAQKSSSEKSELNEFSNGKASSSQLVETNKVENSDSKNSLASFSLEEARRSMENSIALLRQAKNESSKEVDQLCAKTQNVVVSEKTEREKKLKNAREIIGNAIQPGVRKPPVPFGSNDPSAAREKSIPPASPSEEKEVSIDTISTPNTPEDIPISNTTKTSRAEITLKSATLPRRKAAKSEIKIAIKPKYVEQPMRFSTEMHHQIPDLRSAPVRAGPPPYSPVYVQTQRATSLEPQLKERIIPVQRLPSYVGSSSNTIRSGSLPRQSTIDSDTDTNTTNSQTNIQGSSQPIKKSPREFIIPIAVEGGGYVTPRAGSLEPSESNHTTSSVLSRIGRPRRVGSILTEAELEDDSSVSKISNSFKSNDGEIEEPRFTMHRLRSTRPVKKLSQDGNDSQSSGEDDDEDGFEILTAENLFSTLLQRVRALTNRLNINNDISSAFPNSRLLGNMRQTHSPFWNQDRFGSRLNNPGSSWRYSLSRDLGSDIDSMFSRSGATLPKGRNKTKNNQESNECRLVTKEEPLDLADLDLSRLRLTKKDLETLSNIAPDLPKCYQDQLLAKLPPTQARKLSRTLSMQNEYQNDSAATAAARLSKRRFSVEREIDESVTNTGEHKSTSSCKHGEKDFYLNGRCNNCPDGSKKEVPLICTKNCRVNDYNSESNPVSDDYNSSLCSSYSSEINDKYKYYSPYLGKRNEYERSLSPCKYYESVSPRSSDVSPGKDVYGRPPSGCFFPTTIAPYNSLRRRSFQRGSSRFLRLDFHEPHTDENVLVREKRLRERETQSVLREIREKSRERNHDRRSLSVEKSSDLDKCYNRHLDPKTNIDLNTSSMNSSADTTRHVRNKSIEVFSDYGDRNDGKERKRRSSSRSKDMMIEENVNCTNKIIEELQNISSNIKKAQSDIINCDDGISEKYKVKIIMKSGKSKEKPINITDSRITDIQRIPEIVSNIKMPKSEKEKKIKKSSKYPESSTLTEKGLEISDLKNEAVVEIEKTKIESKLLKPKFYSIKKDDNKSLESSKSGGNIENSHEKRNIKDEPENLHIETSRIARPKSYPNSKITSTKDLKKSSRSGSTVSAVMEKLMEKVEKSSGTKNMVNILNTSGQQATIQAVTPSLDNPESKPMETIRVSGLPSPVDGNKTLVKKVFGNKGTKLVGNKLKSPDKELNDKTAVEKKSGQGFLHAIGQKFEKLRENARNRDKINTMISDEMGANKEKQDTMEKIVKKKKSKSIIPDRITTNNNLEENENKIDKKSQITAIIHSLRECSVPRQTAVTESVLLKHAVSVEDMSTTFNKRNVNKVLGLFKKFEKNDHNRKVLNTKSTSDIEKHISHNINQKDKIKSNKFINRMRKTKTISPTKVLKTDSFDNNEKNNIIQKSVIPKDAVTTNTNYPKAIQNNCLECSQEKVDNLTKRSQLKEINSFVNQEKESSKAKRKGLVLDLSNHKKIESNENGNILDNYLHTNNNLTRNDTEEINHNYLLTPPNENPTNYSTDSRSPDNECPSSSTFLSPSEEVDLCFDNWSVRSDDNLIKKTIPPPSLYPSSSSTISRFSRVSQFSSPTNNENLGDSVNDRIKRRSFYICFNEKRPKPHSNILGSEIRDYYRETAADYHRSRPSDRVVSPNNDNNTHHNTYEYIKPRKLSSAGGNDLRSSCNNRLKSTTTDYIKPRTNIHDTIGNRHVDNNDYIQLRSSHIEPTTTTHYYNTLDPKRRSSFGSNGKSQIGLTDIDGYATLGRLIRPYKNSSILDQTTNNITASSIGGSLRRDKRTPIELRNLPKSSTSIPTPSVARSPTNI